MVPGAACFFSYLSAIEIAYLLRLDLRARMIAAPAAEIRSVAVHRPTMRWSPVGTGFCVISVPSEST